MYMLYNMLDELDIIPSYQGDMFYSDDKKFIEDKRDEYEKFYNYLKNRAKEFNNIHQDIDVSYILRKYYKKLNIDFCPHSDYIFGIRVLKNYEQFKKDEK